jgi:hypothetical protein
VRGTERVFAAADVDWSPFAPFFLASRHFGSLRGLSEGERVHLLALSLPGAAGRSAGGEPE